MRDGEEKGERDLERNAPRPSLEFTNRVWEKMSLMNFSLSPTATISVGIYIHSVGCWIWVSLSFLSFQVNATIPIPI
jgi:hypothetical protein